MSVARRPPSPYVLPDKPTASFSSISSAASATSAATTRSGGSRLLFGEIDTTTDRSDGYASVCSLVLSDSSTFLRFWLTDHCRNSLISCLNPHDLASLRLVCHDFSVRAASALFADLVISFKPNSFTKPSRMAALDRLGTHVKSLTFNLPHTSDTFLPPLIHPDTGDEFVFTYTPQLFTSASRPPKYGDPATTDILTRQYPPLFHAATNVSAFVRALSAFVNLSHLTVACTGHDPSFRYRRSTVDFALISLRIAIERNCLNALDTLTLSPIHPSGLLYLSPLLGCGASPSSARRWSRIRHLTIHADTLTPFQKPGEPDQLDLLHAFLRNFKPNLQTLSFRWNGAGAPFPISSLSTSDPPLTGDHPAHAMRSSTSNNDRPLRRLRAPPVRLVFPNLHRLGIENATATAREIAAVLATHAHTLHELDLRHVHLAHGSWDDAFAALAQERAGSARAGPAAESADIPIMLSPSNIASVSNATIGSGNRNAGSASNALINSSGSCNSTAGVSNTTTTTTTTRSCKENLAGVNDTACVTDTLSSTSTNTNRDKDNIPSELFPRPMERLDLAVPSPPRSSATTASNRRNGATSSLILPPTSTSTSTPTFTAASSSSRKSRAPAAAARRVKLGLLGCEEQVRKILRSAGIHWV